MPKKNLEREARRERRKERMALLEGAGITDVGKLNHIWRVKRRKKRP